MTKVSDSISQAALPPLVILTGPTAAGKTALSVALAKAAVSYTHLDVYKRQIHGSLRGDHKKYRFALCRVRNAERIKEQMMYEAIEMCIRDRGRGAAADRLRHFRHPGVPAFPLCVRSAGFREGSDRFHRLFPAVFPKAVGAVLRQAV